VTRAFQENRTIVRKWLLQVVDRQGSIFVPPALSYDFVRSSPTAKALSPTETGEKVAMWTAMSDKRRRTGIAQKAAKAAKEKRRPGAGG
jgi:hypothetical protein